MVKKAPYPPLFQSESVHIYVFSSGGPSWRGHPYEPREDPTSDQGLLLEQAGLPHTLHTGNER